MKKLLLSSFILFCLQLAPSKAQWVTIPDSNFVTKLTQLFPSCMNGNQMDTTCSLIVNATTVSVYGNNLIDITGIEYFDNLIGLYCNNNMLSTIPTLPNSLKYLYCNNNQLTSLPVLSNNLRDLRCNNNQLSSLPLLADSLRWFYCDSNQITTLPTLPNYLIYFRCENNLLTSLPTLPDSIYGLYCNNNLLSSLPTLPGVLRQVDCSNNQLTSLPAIDSLTELNCANNQLTSLPQVPNFMNQFYINNNNILCLTNLPQVYNNNGNISNNPFTCVPNQTNYSLALPLCVENDLVNNPNNCIGANIMGTIYKDLNNNCSYDNTDLNTNNIPVKLYNNLNNLIAQSYTLNGLYYFSTLQPGNYLVKIDDTSLPFSMSCGQLNNQSVTLGTANQTIQNINFAVDCDTASDIFVQSVTHQGLIFPGQTHIIKTNVINNLNAYNLNCISGSYSGTVTIEVTGAVNYLSPDSNALVPVINGNAHTYSISDFNNLTPTSFGMKFMTDTAANIGDQICVHVEINSNPIDGDTTNNQYDFCYYVVNSYDPNMKEVYPSEILQGYDDWFTYTIHFQNTGNATAFNIRLRDTLDTQFDLTTFEILGYSHEATTTLNNNILTVRFNNIMLPDSTTDYEGSMGYFQYRIKALSNLAFGALIENTAFIYFDYNAPVITNTTQSIFQMLTNIQNNSITENKLILYPNPSNGIFNFMDNSAIKTVEVFNLLGEQIISQTNQKQIDLTNYSKGIYFAKINGNTVIKLIRE